jgi:hypothetical protein
MTYLVACLSTGKDTWVKVIKLVKSGQFDKCFLITNAFGKEHFTAIENAELVLVNADKNIDQLVEDIKKGLQGKIIDTEVALNLTSGSGKEHMALLSALLKLGLGIRLVDMQEETFIEV